ncbi:MAG TPA: PAS domain-containing protein [Alphaproteobacteria bacterium]|nr:PAS domain-containing protein [Alphaproteobacteria bacterium]
MFELPTEASEPEFVDLYGYWRRIAPSGRLPGRQHVDPAELPPRILSHLLLLDVVRGPDDLAFRFRLAGTAFAELVGREVTGLCYHEIAAPEQTAAFLTALRRIATMREPAYLVEPLSVPSRDYVKIKRLGLPLARDGEMVDMIIGSFLPIRASGAASAQPRVA